MYLILKFALLSHLKFYEDTKCNLNFAHEEFAPSDTVKFCLEYENFLPSKKVVT